MKKYLPLILFFLTNSLGAQERYLNPVFTDLNVTSAIYGRNFTIIEVHSLGHTIETGKAGQPLAADIYTPKGDTESKRPLVIYFHTGNFLPFPQNISASGSRKDSTCVDIVKKFARMGYVAASVDYRLGWNPIGPSQEVRANTLVNAIYRGVQDARTAIRYFKANADLYGVDTNRIMIYGQGTGGYITMATASLDSYTEVLTTTAGTGKFIGSNALPYVNEKITLPGGEVLYINGDIEGKVYGFVPPNADGTINPGPPPTGDTLCFPNHVNHSSKFAMAINMGGALADISWLDVNTVPMVCIQTPYDPFDPYNDDLLSLPIGPGLGILPVVRFQGSLAVQVRMDVLGINDPFLALDPAKDPIGQAIKGKAGGHVNLFPVVGSYLPLENSPWDFWDPATNPNHAYAIQTNPDMTAEKGRRFIDSILMFLAPRACIGLDLPCKASVVSSTVELSDDDVTLNFAPNPTSDKVRIQVRKETPMKHIYVMDMTGRTVLQHANVNATVFEVNRNNLNDGLYIVRIEFEKGVLVKKLIFE
ncbi:MAG: T9SS type A sorting domain-containing protein [Saprospiraceae bacterium]|nr:T9SS type A sorting domain-containing protein [Saprospiraceae bacterium]